MGSPAIWFFKHQKAKSWVIWGEKVKIFLLFLFFGKIFHKNISLGAGVLSAQLGNQHQCFHLMVHSLVPVAMKYSLSLAEETEAQRDQVIYQIHATLEAEFKPQRLMESPLVGHGVTPLRMSTGGGGVVWEMYTECPTTQTVKGVLDRVRGPG